MINDVTKNILFLFTVVSVFNACNGPTSMHDTKNRQTISAYDSTGGKSFIYTKYELPLSVDVFKYLKAKNCPFSMDWMHKLKDQGKYFTDTKRAFALGVYSADLAYAAVYEKSQDAVNYFGASIELAHKLNIQDGYNSNTLDRAYENINNEDSLTKIAGESYWRTCSSLEKNRQENILPLVVAGSWIESMHILVKHSVESKPDSGMFKELYEQLKHLEKLLNYMTDAMETMQLSDSKSDIGNVLARLKIIHEKFLLIDSESSESLSLANFNDVIFQIESLRSWMLD